MSFPWDGMYALVLQNWPSPGEARACAGEPFTELRQATAREHFDVAQLISTADYELVPETVPAVTVTCGPDFQQWQGVVHQLRARPGAVGRLMRFQPPE